VTKEQENDIMQRALFIYGIHAQETLLIEECAELIKAVCKHWRWHEKKALELKAYEDMIEEIEDVRIMLDQIILSYKDFKFASEIRESKLNRLLDRVTASEKGSIK